jgi:uncharacterized cupin superfamily protein
MPRMRRVNLSQAELTYDEQDPDGFRSGMWRFGAELGARESGTSLYELPPGQAVCPYHYEHGEEEWVLVLQGRPTLRTPEGSERLEPMDVAFFPKGPDGAHQLRNDSEETVRILMWGTVVYPTVSVYPDSDKIGVWTEGRVDNVIVERSAGVEYFHGE